MAKNIGNIPAVESFVVEESSTNLDKKWKIWKEDFLLYLDATGVTQDAQRKALLLHLGGKDLKMVYRTLQHIDDNFHAVVTKLDSYFQPKKNVTYERYVFKQVSQNKDELTTAYITRLRTLAETCEFRNDAEEIRDHFVTSCYSKSLKQKLLKIENLTLDKCIQVGRTTELAKKQAAEMSNKDELETEDREANRLSFQQRDWRKENNKPRYQNEFSQNNKPRYQNEFSQNNKPRYQNEFSRKPFHQNSRQTDSKLSNYLCYRCGDEFTKGHNEHCRANGKTCYNCNKKDHLSSCCKSSQFNSRKTNRANKLHEENYTESEASEDEFTDALINSLSRRNKTSSVHVKIEGVTVSMIVDSGSTVSILDNKTFRKIQNKLSKQIHVKKSKAKIYPYASDPIKTRGYFNTTIESTERFTTQKVYIVDKEVAGNLLSIQAAKELRIIQVNSKEQQACLVINTANQIAQTSETTNQIAQLSDETCDVKIETPEKNVNKLLQEYEDIFSGHGKLKNYKVKLYVNQDVQPVVQKLRRQPYHLREAIQKELDRLESEDIIEKVEGPQQWVSNLVVIPKKNGNVRLCLDARVINTAIMRERYPIPTLDSIIDQMNGAKVFAKLDMKEAYTQLELDEESRDITCFNSEEGVYRQKRLVYGINNSFEIFQRSMEQNFGCMKGVKFISDDIILYAKNDDELLQILHKVFEKVRTLGLKLNKTKCVFKQSKISFFGIEISEKGINPDPNKISNLRNALPPSNVNELRSFLGLCTYVSRFIPSFSEKTAVLRELLKGNTKFKWTTEHEKAFTLLKNELTSDSVLGFYDPQKDVELVTDASNYSIGGILLQKDVSGLSRPICYVSKSLTASEIKYGITEKEALALVWCIEKLHLYLFGKTFTVTVDHEPLKFIFSPRAKLNARIARWQLRLQGYDFTINYKKGSENIADFISRMRNVDIEDTVDEDTDDHVQEYLNFLTEISTPKVMNINEIREASQNDRTLVAVGQAILTSRW